MKTQLKVYCDESLKIQLETLARQNRKTVSSLSVEILSSYLAHNGFEPTKLDECATEIKLARYLLEGFLEDYFGPEGKDAYITLLRRIHKEVLHHNQI